MLIKFIVENYKSIKDKLVLNMVAASNTDHEDTNVVHFGDLRLLKSAAIYGANASGKSNLLDALAYMKWLVIHSAKDLNKHESLEHIEPFILSAETINNPTKFEVELYLESKRYRYGFWATTDVILREYLFENDDYLFIRSENEYFISDEFESIKNQNIESKTRENALFLSKIYQENVTDYQYIYDWFFKLSNLHGLQSEEYREETNKLLKKETEGSIIKNIIKRIDVGIEDLNLIEIEIDESFISNNIPKNIKKEFIKKNRPNAQIATTQVFYNKDGNPENIQLPFDKFASDGTKKFYDIIGKLINAILKNQLIIIDEFDARLHPFLAKSIIKLFNSDIDSNGQLIFATHSAALLDENLLRRDQIYLIEKDDRFGSSQLSSIVEYKIDENPPNSMMENYLNGRYGGIPYINDFSQLIKPQYDGSEA